MISARIAEGVVGEQGFQLCGGFKLDNINEEEVIDVPDRRIASVSRD